jgi:hypothetical protein
MNPTPELQLSQADDIRHRLVPAAKVILRRASGSLELGELLLVGEAAAPPTACRLFRRALAELSQLDEADRRDAAATVLEGESLRALGEWDAALPPLMHAAHASCQRVLDTSRCRPLAAGECARTHSQILPRVLTCNRR